METDLPENDKSWDATKRNLAIGTLVLCQVKEHHPFGVFTTIADLPFDGLIQITDFKDEGKSNPTEFPPKGSEVQAVVLGFKELGKQI